MKREDWDERYRAAELVWSAEPNRFAVAECADLPAGHALDLACGEGRNAIWLAERGWQVTAVDFSSVAVARAEKIAQARGVSVAWQVADVLEYSPRECFFDLVLVMYLHMPWSDMRVAIGSAARAVAPGGMFLFVGHDRDNLEHGHGGPRDPAVLYSPEQVAGELAAFTIERAERVRRRIAPSSDRTTHRHTGPDSSDDVFAIDNLVRAMRPLTDQDRILSKQ